GGRKLGRLGWGGSGGVGVAGVGREGRERPPTRRYESASALAADVQRHLHHEPVQACPPSATYLLRKFARRHKGRLALAAGVAAVLAILIAGLGWVLRDPEGARGRPQSLVDEARAGAR